MKQLLEEILEIPERARECYQKSKGVRLPQGVSYLGMGSSYYAPMTLSFCGVDINPRIASEFYYYYPQKAHSLGVLISQSGETSETVWCLERFEKVIAITNDPASSLATSQNVEQLVSLYAGEEKFLSSTKTYVNTLIALSLGLGLDPLLAVEAVEENFASYQEGGEHHAETIAVYLRSRRTKGLYIIGSGPNFGTACDASLVLSESTKYLWAGMSVAQYDHGPKETAEDTVVIMLNAGGYDQKRLMSVARTLREKTNALIVELDAHGLPEKISPISFIVQIHFIMNYLADLLEADKTGLIGGKITTVDKSIK